MVRLVLAGGGSAEDSKDLDQFFVNLIPDEKKLLYIPIAGDSKTKYEDCFNWIKSAFSKFNLHNITMWTKLKNRTLKEVRNFDAIYIGGGNTFKLLFELRKSGFLKILGEFIRGDGLVYGGSAGAIIMGKNILTSPDENNFTLKDFSALNLLNNHSIWCHYNDSQDSKIFDYFKSQKTPVIALTEKSGLFVNNNHKIKVIGLGKVVRFDEKGETVFNSDFQIG